MISTRVQAADPKDLRALVFGRGSLWRNLLVASLPIALLIGLAAFALSRSVGVSVALALVFFFTSARSNIGFFRNVRRIESESEALVECIEVEASYVLDLEPQGSNGPVVALLSESGDCLLLVGQWLLEQKKFPSRHMRVYRWRVDGEPIRTESLGPKVKPEHSFAGLKNTHLVAQIHIFPAKLESLAHDLDIALSAGAG